MRVERHAKHTEILFGVRADDIHKWIDQYFDQRRFRQPFWRLVADGWSPYEHRKYLHHKEALPQAIEVFKDKYSEDIIEKIFIQHLKDDYNGYVPSKKDFDDPGFMRRFHH